MMTEVFRLHTTGERISKLAPTILMKYNCELYVNWEKGVTNYKHICV